MKLDLKHLNKIFWLQVLFLIISVAIYSGYLLLSGTISVEASETEINKILSDLKENAVVMNDLNTLIDDLKSELNNFITSNTPRNTEEIDRIKSKLNDIESKLNLIPDIRIIETTRSNSRVPKLNLKKNTFTSFKL